MKKLKKILKLIVKAIIITIIIFLLIHFFYPQATNGLLNKLRGLTSNNLSARKEDEETSFNIDKAFGNILGEESEQESKKDLSQEELVKQLKDLSNKILDQEMTKEIREKINQVVTEKVKEVKEIPEEQIDKLRKQIKEEIYQGICQDWLKEKLIEED